MTERDAPDAGDDDAGVEDALYDGYLDACLEGVAPSPETYLADHPEASPDLQRRLASLHRALGTRAGTQAGEAAPATAADLPFARIGGYRLIRRLGTGGMGTVYIAEQDTLRRRVALKIIRSELRQSDVVLRRFEREAQSVARLRHPNIVTVYEFGSEADCNYIAMELVRGRPLDEVLRDEPPGHEQIVAWCVQIARALAYAHEQGIVHRDVKPQNIMITAEGRAVLLDFGIAHVMGTQVTRLTSDFAGSPLYAAPEQLREASDKLDGRADVYALGVTLYEALTGRAPFEGGRLDEVLMRILREEPAPPRTLVPEIERDLETVILKALEKQPDRRYATAHDLAEDLQRVLDHRPILATRPGALVRLAKWTRRHPIGATLIAAALVATLTIAGLAWKRARDDRARAARLVAEAEVRIGALREARLAAIEMDERVEARARQRETRWFTHEEDREFDRLKDEVVAARQARDSGYVEVDEKLTEALRLDPEVAGVPAVRARLFLEQAEEARTAGDAGLELHWRRELARADPSQAVAGGLGAQGEVVLASAEPGARVHLFRLEEQRGFLPEGDRRLVPVPVHVDRSPLPAPLRAGAWALRIVRGAGDVAPGDLVIGLAGQPVRESLFAGADGRVIRRGDRLLEIDGRRARSLVELAPVQREGTRRYRFERDGEGFDVRVADLDVPVLDARGFAEQGDVEARVFRNGRIETLVLGKGLVLRPTATPRYLTPACVVGTTPLAGPLRLPVGRYVAVFRKAGREDLVWPFAVRRDTTTSLRANLLPAGTTPVGFVHVPGIAFDQDPEMSHFEDHAFWIMEREVTCGEYKAFLDANPQRDVQRPDHLFMRLPDTRWTLRPGVDPALPVSGLSFATAQAYAAWRSQTERKSYALPRENEWKRALAPMGRHYVYGTAYHPKWSNTLLSQAMRISYPEPAFRYPIDESPLGVYDATGNAGEWLDAWWGEPRQQLRQWTGGSYAHANPEEFRILGGGGSNPAWYLSFTGMRLVLRMKAPR